MTEFVAWVVLLGVVASWATTPWSEADIARFFRAESLEEVWRHITSSTKWIATIAFTLTVEVAAVVLALIVIL